MPLEAEDRASVSCLDSVILIILIWSASTSTQTSAAAAVIVRECDHFPTDWRWDTFHTNLHTFALEKHSFCERQLRESEPHLIGCGKTCENCKMKSSGGFHSNCIHYVNWIIANYSSIFLLSISLLTHFAIASFALALSYRLHAFQDPFHYLIKTSASGEPYLLSAASSSFLFSQKLVFHHLLLTMETQSAEQEEREIERPISLVSFLSPSFFVRREQKGTKREEMVLWKCVFQSDVAHECGCCFSCSNDCCCCTNSE